MGQICRIDELITYIEPMRKSKKIGLITGCFDIMHKGHLDMFKFSKRHVDFLIVGIDHDDAIKKTKGSERPIFSQKIRSETLAEIVSVDYVLLLENKDEFSSKKANKYYDEITYKVCPDALFTSSKADIYWNIKKKRADKINAKLILSNIKRPISTTAIINKLYAMETI